MGQPGAKKGDKIVAIDTRLIKPPGESPPVRVAHSFNGIMGGKLSRDVKIMGMPAATVDSTANNLPPHVPIGGTFVNPPSNQATIISGSMTVKINGKQAARNADRARTCNDPTDLPVGSVVAVGSVLIGG